MVVWTICWCLAWHSLHLVQLLSLLLHIFSVLQKAIFEFQRWNATLNRFKGSDFIDQIHTICSILGTPEALGGFWGAKVSLLGLVGGEGRLHYSDSNSNLPPSVAWSILMPLNRERPISYSTIRIVCTDLHGFRAKTSNPLPFSPMLGETLQASELSFIPEENSAARSFIQNRFGYMPPQ